MAEEAKITARELIIAPTALRDLKEIWTYIADDNESAADRVLEGLERTLTRIAQFPGSGHLRRDLAEQRPVLFVTEGSYQILYRVSQYSVEIIAVLHGSRDIPAVLRDRDPEE